MKRSRRVRGAESAPASTLDRKKVTLPASRSLAVGANIAELHSSGMVAQNLSQLSTSGHHGEMTSSAAALSPALRPRRLGLSLAPVSKQPSASSLLPLPRRFDHHPGSRNLLGGGGSLRCDGRSCPAPRAPPAVEGVVVVDVRPRPSARPRRHAAARPSRGRGERATRTPLAELTRAPSTAQASGAAQSPCCVGRGGRVSDAPA